MEDDKNNNPEIIKEDIKSSTDNISQLAQINLSVIGKSMNEAESVIKHARSVIDMNSILITQNRVLEQENRSIKRTLNKMENVLSIKCPYCNSNIHIHLDGGEPEVTKEDNDI